MKKLILLYSYAIILAMLATVAHSQPSCNATFNFSPNNACEGTTIQFNGNNPSGSTPKTWKWYFGDGNTSTLQNPTHVYNPPANGTGTQTYTVSFVTTAGTLPFPFCKDSITQIITVKTKPDIILLDVGNLQFTNCASVTIQYDLTVSDFSAPLNNTYFTIIWGDATPNFNSSSAPNNLIHTYNSLGYFTLKYIVTGISGCSDTAIYQVFNGSNPAIGLGNPGNTSGCTPLSLTFPITGYANNPPGTIYTVAFNDGSPSVIYSHPPPDSVVHVFSSGSCGTISYNGLTPYPNSFGVTITAQNPCGTSAAGIVPIYISEKPHVAMAISPDTIDCINTIVSFISNSDPGSSVTSSGVCDTNEIVNWVISPSTGWTTTGQLGLNPPIISVPATWGSDPLPVVFSVPGVYNITLYIRNASCGVDSITRSVCILPLPIASFLANPLIGCKPLNVNTTNLSNTLNNCDPPTYQWTVTYLGSNGCLPTTGNWIFTGGTNQNSINPKFLFNDPGQYEIKLTVTNKCGSDDSLLVITVKDKPQFTITQIPNFCQNGTVTPAITLLNNCLDPGAPTFLWTFTGGSPTTSTLQNPLPVTYSAAGNYTITLTVTNSCGLKKDSVLFTVYPIPQPVAIASPYTICLGANSTLSVTNNNSPPNPTYSWSPATGLSATTGNSVIASPPVTTIYTVNATATFGSTGCTAIDTVKIIVLPLPPVSVNANPNPVCLNDTSFLIASGATSYTWTPASGLNATTGNSVYAIVTNPSGQTYTVTGTNTAGCSNTASINISAYPLPIVNAHDTSLCDNGGNVQLTATPIGGIWSGNYVSPAGLYNTNTSPSGLFFVFYSYTDLNGCSNKDTAAITIFTPASAVAGPDDSLCLSLIPIQLNGSPPGGTWSGTNVTPSGIYTPSTVGVFNLVYSYGAGSCLSNDTMKMNVIQLPSMSNNNLNAICFGDSIQIICTSNNNPYQAVLFSWTPIAGLTTTNTSSVWAHPSITTNYTVLGTSTYGCTNTATSLLTVNPLPVVNAGPDSTVCNQPIPVTLNGSPIGGTWSGPGVVGNTFNPNIAGVGAWNLVYSFTDGNFCSNSDTAKYTVQAPAIAWAGPDDSICFNALPIQLVDSPAGGTWSGTNVTPGGIFTPSTVGVFNLVYSYGAGSCLSNDTMKMNVMQLPSMSNNNLNAICFGDSIQIICTSNNNPYQAVLFSWTPIAGLTTTNTASVWAHPSITTNYTVLGTSTYGCTNTATSLLTVNPLPVVNAGPDSTVCNQPIPVTLNGSPIGGTWSGSGVIGNVFNPNIAGVGVWNLVYSYTDGNGCKNKDTAKYTVQAPSIAWAGPDDSICFNALPIQLVDSPAGGNWSGTNVTPGGIFTPSTVGVFNLVYSYGAGSCLSQDTMKMTVMQLPSMSNNNLNAICFGDSIQINCTSNNNPYQAVQFSWTPIAGLTTTNTASVWAHPSITTNYTVLGTSTYGCTNTATSLLTVNPLPVVNAGPDSTVCNQPIPVTLNGSPIGGTWSGPGVVGNTFNPNIAGVGAWNLVYSYTDGNGCKNKDTAKYTVQAPSIAWAGPDDSICFNALPIQLVDSPAGGNWSGTNVTPGGIFTPSTVGVFNLVYSYGAGSCLSQDTMKMTVMQLPSMSNNNLNAICFGDSIQINCTSNNNPYQAVQFSWTPIAGLTTTNTASVWAHPSITTNYTVLGTSTYGCTNTATSLLTVNPLPVVNAGPDSAVCNQPIPVTLNGSPIGGTWSGPGVVGNTFNPNIAGVGAWNLVYSFTDGNFCSNSDTAKYTVQAPAIAWAGPDDSICFNALPIQLVDSPAGGNWSGTNVTPGGIFTPTVVGPNFLVYSIGSGTCLNKDTVLITVNPLPPVNVNSAIICYGNDTVLTASGAITYSWSPATGLSATTGSVVTANPLITTIYTVTGTDNVTGCSQTATSLVVVNPLPQVIAGNDTSFCNQPILVSISVTNSPSTGGLWSGTGINANGTFTPLQPDTFYAYFYFTDNNGCSNSDSLLIYVSDPTQAIAGPDDSVCIDVLPFILSGFSPPLGFWTGTGITNPSTGLFDPAIAGAGTHQLTYTFGTGSCETMDTVILTVNPLPLVIVNSDTICVGENTILIATGAISYSWSPATGLSATTGDIVTANPVITTIYTVTGTDNVTGCSQTATSLVVVNPLPQVIAGNDTSFCNQPILVTISVTNFPLIGGLWSGTGINANGTFTPLQPDTFYAYFYFTDLNGCTNSDSLLIYVSDPTQAIAGPDDSVCIDVLPFILPGFSPPLGFWTGQADREC